TSLSAPSPQEPRSLVETAYQQGWLMAGNAIEHLQHVGILPTKEKPGQRPRSLSLGILMELSALLRLQAWHEGGVRDTLTETIPAAVAALDESAAKLTSDLRMFAHAEELPPLTEHVFALWKRHLAWSGLEELTADIFLHVSPADEEAMLEDLADLLWNH